MIHIIDRKPPITALVATVTICLLLNIAAATILGPYDVSLGQFQRGDTPVVELHQGQKEIFFRFKDLKKIKSQDSLQIVVTAPSDHADLELWYSAHDDDNYIRIDIQRAIAEDISSGLLPEGIAETLQTFQRLDEGLRRLDQNYNPSEGLIPKTLVPGHIIVEYAKQQIISFIMFLGRVMTGNHPAIGFAARRIPARQPMQCPAPPADTLADDHALAEAETRLTQELRRAGIYRAKLKPDPPSTELLLHQPVFRLRISMNAPGKVTFWAGYSSFIATFA